MSESLGQKIGAELAIKPGTLTLRLNGLEKALDGDKGAPLASALKVASHQMAGMLREMAKPGMGLVASYEAGYPAYGRASGPAREALGVTIHPDRLKEL